MKDLMNNVNSITSLYKYINEASILDVEGTISKGDDYAKMQENLDFTAKFNKKYELDLFSKTDHCKQPIAIGDVILCEWLGAVRPGIVLAFNDDNKLTVTFDGDTNTNFNIYRRNKRLVAFDIEPFRVIKCTPKLIKAIKDLI